jgi:hypothetical protein
MKESLKFNEILVLIKNITSKRTIISEKTISIAILKS